MTLVIVGQSTNEELVAGLEGFIDTAATAIKALIQHVVDFFKHVNILLFGYGGAAGDAGSIRAKLRSDRWKEFKARGQYGFLRQLWAKFVPQFDASDKSQLAVRHGGATALGTFDRLLNHGPLKSWSVTGVPQTLTSLCDKIEVDLADLTKVTSEVTTKFKNGEQILREDQESPSSAVLPTIEEYIELAKTLELDRTRLPGVSGDVKVGEWVVFANHVASAYIGNSAPSPKAIGVTFMTDALDDVLVNLPKLVSLVDKVTAAHRVNMIKIQTDLTALEKVAKTAEVGNEKQIRAAIRVISNISRIAIPAIKMVVATQERVLELDKQIHKFAAEVS